MNAPISDAVSKWLVSEGVVLENEQTLFSFAFNSMIFGLLPVLIALGFGLLFGIPGEGVLMILPFMALRKFSGGFHFRDRTTCIIVSTVLIALSCCVVKWMMTGDHLVLFSVCVALAAISISWNSPIENQARKLLDKESALFRRVTWVLAGVFFALYLLFLFTGCVNCTASLGVGLLLPAGLQLPCLLRKRCRAE